MWYDLLVLAILGYFALRGAAKGLLNQLASIAAIVVCMVFAESFSAIFGPMVHLEPPLNNWVVMFGAYLFCTFIAFGLARVLDDWVSRAKLESFNQHLGFIFGLAKGGLLVLVMTFFLVTLSPASRSALSNSKAAYAAAHLMDKLHPIMPAKLQEALAKYLHISSTGQLESELQAGANPPPPLNTPGGTTNPPIEWTGNNTVSPFPDWTQPNAGNPANNGNTSPAPPTVTTSQQAIDLFVSQLPASVNSDLRNLLRWSLQNTPPEQQTRVQQDLRNMLSQARPEDLYRLQTQLSQTSQPSLINVLTNLFSFVPPRSTTPLAPTSTQPTYPTPGYQQPNYQQPNYTQPGYSTPSYSQPGPTNAQPTYSQPSVAQPTTSGYPPSGGYVSQTNGYQTGTGPNYGQTNPTYTPPPLQASPQSQQDQLLAEISRAFSSIQPVQVQVQADIRRKLSGLPPEVSLSVLEDWRRDLWQPQSRDPDPSTDSGTTLEQRIVRQLQARGIPVNRLSSEVQSRLEGATLR
ncbi:MAG: CvpA family protein [Planctomycetaceae bacterium]